MNKNTPLMAIITQRGVIFIIITRYVNGVAVSEEELLAENIIGDPFIGSAVEKTVKTVRYRITKYREDNPGAAVSQTESSVTDSSVTDTSALPNTAPSSPPAAT